MLLVGARKVLASIYMIYVGHIHTFLHIAVELYSGSAADTVCLTAV